jgi:hypothetical protein
MNSQIGAHLTEHNGKNYYVRLYNEVSITLIIGLTAIEFTTLRNTSDQAGHRR